jgi:hypothetical protein
MEQLRQRYHSPVALPSTSMPPFFMVPANIRFVVPRRPYSKKLAWSSRVGYALSNS